MTVVADTFAVGTLNIVDAADEAGLLVFADGLAKLERTSFRVRPELAAAFRESVQRRKEGR